MPRKAKPLPYVDLQKYSSRLPTQLVRKVWGLGRHPRIVDCTLCSSDLQLMDMDAPSIIPAGSMRREEQRNGDCIAFSREHVYQPREGGPWRY